MAGGGRNANAVRLALDPNAPRMQDFVTLHLRDVKSRANFKPAEKENRRQNRRLPQRSSIALPSAES